MQTSRKWLFLLLTLFIFSFVGQISAQDDEVFTGEVNDKDEDEYSIELDEGDAVIITAIAPDGSELDTYLILENEDGDTVAENDDYEFPTSTNSRIAYIAEEDGEYTLIVTNYPGTSGEYEVTVEFVSEAEVDDINRDVEDILGDPDEEYDGEIEDGDEDEYTVELDAAEAVIIVADGHGDLDTYLILENEDGDTVAENDDYDPGATLDSRIVYIADEDGDYTIIMSNYPGSEGDYDLTLYIVSEEEALAFMEAEGIRAEINTTPERDPDQSYEGTIEDDDDTDEYTIELEEGDGIIVALFETDGEMDTFLYVLNPDGVEIAANDDRGDYETLDSQIGFTAAEDGDYTIVVDNFPGFPGDYRLEIYFASEDEVALAEQAMRVIFTGPVELFDTEHFRIHYTTEGFDAADPDFVEEVAEAVEEVYAIQIEELGWARPPTDGFQGGDERYDVYLINLDDIYGYASSSSGYADNPFTDVLEEFARAGYLVLDNDYSDYADPIQAMRATTAHEFHHVVQYGYDDSDMNWYYEATASWMETVTFPDDEEATIYVEDVYNYPEACFGGDGDADITGLGIYGTWLFFEFASEHIDDDFAFELWNNIGVLDGWEPLEVTLEAFDWTIPDAVAVYHINNLVRDYAFVNDFDDVTIWVEAEIDDEGDWTFEGEGIQELGANYYILDLNEDSYEFTLNDADESLELYVIGIDGDEGVVYALEDGGVVDLDGYDDSYLMVFNRDYDDDITRCRYQDYEIEVEESSDDALDPIIEVDADEFDAPKVR